MKAEYDFSKGTRGRFHHPNAVFSSPIYLEPDVDGFMSKLAEEQDIDIQKLVNEWLRVNIFQKNHNERKRNMEWLRDPIWQFIGAAVGIVAIIVSYMFFKRQQKQKRIAYAIISSTSLLSVRNEVKSKLQVFFEQKPIENLSLLIVKIYNAGNEPVLPTDYEKPISIGFGDKAEVLEADITGVSPESIQPKIDRTPKAVSLQPLLLNGGDSITLKVLLADFDGNVSVTGRIAGVKQISGSGSARLSPRSFRTDLILIYLLSVAGTCIGTLTTAVVIATGEILPGIVFSVLGLLIALFPIAGIASVNKRTKALLKE